MRKMFKNSATRPAGFHKITSLFVVFMISFLFLSIFPTSNPKSLYADTEGDFTYTVTAGNAQITGYRGGGGGVTIPSTFASGTILVTSIGDEVFSGLLLTSIIIPSGVTSIGNRAFYNCIGLTNITLPSTLTSIGDDAFWGCKDLTSITFNSATTIINDNEGTIPVVAKILGYDPSTAKTYAVKYDRRFESLGAAPIPAASRPLTPQEQVLQNLSIDQQAGLYGRSTTGFVTTLYDNILGRVTDESGLNNWVAAFNNGTLTGSQVAFQIIFSAELAPSINNLNNDDFIAFLYRTLLNRPPEPGGYAGWQEQMRLGMTSGELVNHFVNSPEFAGICTLFNGVP